MGMRGAVGDLVELSVLKEENKLEMGRMGGQIYVVVCQQQWLFKYSVMHCPTGIFFGMKSEVQVLLSIAFIGVFGLW